MAFPHSNSLAEYTPAFPGAVYQPHDWRNDDANGYEWSESFQVPVSADGAGRRRVNLALVPLEQIGVEIEVDEEPRTIIPYGEAPSAGEVALSMETGIVEFHASDAGLQCSASYSGRGTPVMSHLMNQIGAELAAVQQAARPLAGLSAAGLVAHTGEGALAARTLVSSSSGLTVSNGAGTAGNPSLALHANLQGIAAVGTPGTGQMLYTNESAQWALTTLSGFARSLLDDADAATARGTLGLGTVSTQNTATWTADIIPSVTDTVSLGTLTHAWAAVRTYELDVLRDARVTGTLTVDGQILAAAGSAAAPGLAFGSSANTGMWLTSGEIVVTLAGTNRFKLTPSGFVPQGANALGNAASANWLWNAVRLSTGAPITFGTSSIPGLTESSGTIVIGGASNPGSAPGGMSAGTSRWVDRAAQTAVGYSEWIVGETSLTTDTDGAVAYIPIHLTPGSVITAVRARFQGGTTLDGVGVQLVKRVEGSGSATSWTAVGTEAVEVGESVAVVTQTLTAETTVEGTAYAIRVRAQIEGTASILLGVGVRTSLRAV